MDRWTMGGFPPSVRMDTAYFVRKESKMTDIFFSYIDRAKPLNDNLATNDSNSGMDGEKRRKFNQFGISISEAKAGFVLPLFQHNI